MPPGSINSLAWNNEGTQLFATINDPPRASTLWVYDGTNDWQLACEGLPKKVESLETTPDGSLIYGFHQDAQLGIHTLDANACQTLTDARIDTPYNDIEGIAWPATCGPTNLDALRAYLENLDGVEKVDIQPSGAIEVTLNGEIHQSQLAETVSPGTPSAEGQLLMEPIADQNDDGIDDFQITYPSGDQQIMYYLGIKTDEPSECKTLVVPPIDPTVISIPALVTKFLYTGSNPIQTGVATDTINLEQAATIRGSVTTVNGEPLPNVIITIKDHPEYGQTLTTCDGTFNMAVNGNGTLTINYKKVGYLPLQRTVTTAWQKYAVLDDVVMKELDPSVTKIDLTANTPIQVAQGSEVTDEDGTRQAVVLFPQGLTATMTLPDGSTQPLTQLDVRATEYTVGENGPQAMPAPLPPTSAYTYAVDLSVDQAIAVGATRVDFSQPVPLYVDNFLDFPVGGIVPVGWYDYTKGAWVPSDNGRVIEIISIDNSLAILDVDGNGQAASASALAELGITTAERQQLATLYAPGKSLWRSPITHFTPWDCNWPYAPPDDAEPPPNDTEPEVKDEPCECKPREECGCIIEAENQVLGERLTVTGTPFTLNYRSNRVPGLKAPYTLEIPLRGDSVPNSLKQISLEISIVGREFKYHFSPSTESTTFVWDGLDTFGRRLQGPQEAKVDIGYVYGVVYTNPSEFQQSFARFGEETTISGGRGQANITLRKKYTKNIGAWYPIEVGLGSFSLNIHHVYNPMNKVLYQGNGKQRGANVTNYAIINRVVGNGNRWQELGDGGLALEARLLDSTDIVFGPDGNLYIVDSGDYRIRRVDADGIINTVAGNGNNGLNNGFSGDGGLATEASLYYPTRIAFDSDGNLYIADSLNRRVRRVDADGIINTVAGNGNNGFSGDGGLATEASFSYPNGLAFGPDGCLYIADVNANRIRKVSGDGIVNTVVGDGFGYGGNFIIGRFSGDGELATKASLFHPRGIAFGPDGSLYIADSNNARIRSVSVDGIINTVAGNGNWGFSGDGGLAIQTSLTNPFDIAFSADGSLYFADRENNRIRQVTVDGIITTIAGNGELGLNGDGGFATEASLSLPSGIAFGFDDSFYIANSYSNFFINGRIRRVGLALPGFSLGNILIPSENGALFYEFDPSGRHLRTLDTITGKVVYAFSYTDNGYLKEIKDLDGDITRIERDGDTPVAIVAPDGQRTTLDLDDNGYLAFITNPEGEVHELHYSDDGLLKEFINPRQHKSIYRYDEFGLLEEDTDAAGGGWLLARTNHPEGGYTTTMTSKEGRVNTYQVKPQTNGDLLRVNTSPDGTVTQTLKKTNGETVITKSDGTTVVSKQGPDPRFGMQAPITKKLTITTPKGLSAEVTTKKTARLTDNNDPFSIKELTTKVTSNGRTSYSIINAVSKRVTTISAKGRRTVSYFDEKGRAISVEVPGLANAYYAYDERGRLISTTSGEGDEARTTLISYDDKGHLSQLTDALGRSAQFSYDAVGRVTTQILPDERQISYGYDKNGNTTAITPPEKPVHEFDYTAVDLQQQYTPPALTGVSQPQTQYEYNLDKQLIQIRRPDGQVVDLVYDSVKKRLNRLQLPNFESIRYTYDDSTGQLVTLTAPNGSTLSYTYDGSLVLSETWGNGPITGTLSQGLNNDFQVTSTSINGSHTVNYQYDNDGLLTNVGNLRLTHNRQNGQLIATQLGNISTGRTHNTFGEMASETASYNSNPLYHTEYQRDKLGRTTQKVETIEGITTTDEYHYDLAGRLVSVKQDDVVVEAYTYDDNGNRLSANTASGSVIGNYDDQDRLTQYGNAIYTYTENGELRRKNENGQVTTYNYDVLGNLHSVQLPNGNKIEYVIDGQDRRIGKKVNGVLTQAFLYQGSLNPIVELDGNGNVVSQFVYGSKGNVPDYMLKGGKTYRILSNHLGSPKLVVDISDGSIAQRMDYNAFGNVTFDSNPGFQPFGFAGGIYDLDTQLTRFGARDYDAQTGRWTAKDPILFAGGDTNLYGYVLGDPVNFVDIYGLALDDWHGFPSEKEHQNRNQHNACPKKEPQGCGFWDKDEGVLGDKYRSSTGFECAYDAQGNLLPDENGNYTYNYDGGTLPWFSPGHYWKDVIPHFFYGGNYTPRLTK